MSYSYRYLGAFLSLTELNEKLVSMERTPLSRVIQNPHVTFQYQPKETDTSLFGEKIEILAIGYANNGTNEGLLVELKTKNPRLFKMSKNIPVPHITLSVSQTGLAVDTKSLPFQPIKPFSLHAIYGGYTDDEKLITAP